MYNQPYQPPPRKPRAWLVIAFVAGMLILTCVACNLATTANHANDTTANSAASASDVTSTPTSSRHITITQYTATPTHHTVVPTATPTMKPTPTPDPYPPKTLADLHALAAKGDATAIHEFHSESVGEVGVCPQPKRLVTVDAGLTGQRLAEDLLAYFYNQHLDSNCGSIVFVYHNQSEANDVYTAGRINFDALDASGQMNVDPNVTGLRYKLTLDVGGLGAEQEYVVTY